MASPPVEAQVALPNRVLLVNSKAKPLSLCPTVLTQDNIDVIQATRRFEYYPDVAGSAVRISRNEKLPVGLATGTLYLSIFFPEIQLYQ